MYTTGSLDFEMLEARMSAASIVLNNSTLWVVGGRNYPGPDEDDMTYDTTEFISFDYAPIEGPKLPFSVWDHSMIQFDENTIFLIGGSQNAASSNKTWIIGTYS